MEDDLKELESLIAKIDIEPEEAQTEIHIMPLLNADAEDIAKKLQDVYADKLKRNKGAGGSSANVMDKIPSVVPHEGTNSLIVISPPDVFKELHLIVSKLDRKKDKVLIEAVIVELTMDKLHDFGIELSSIDTGKSADYTVFGGAMFGMSQMGVNPSTGGFMRTPIPSSVSGMMGGAAYKNDYSQLPLLIIAAREDKNVSIKAQPQIVANDNEEAFFESSTQVPTIKSSISGEVVSTSSEYHTASMRLAITPHITEKDFLRLEIEQDTERFDQASAVANLPPAKTSRKTKTVVTIPDRATVLLGGLKSEDGSWTEKKVPLLGDIPLLRYLFRRKTWTANESTVFVFISAYIIRSEEDYERISSEKMRTIEELRRQHMHYKEKNPDKGN